VDTDLGINVAEVQSGTLILNKSTPSFLISAENLHITASGRPKIEAKVKQSF